MRASSARALSAHSLPPRSSKIAERLLERVACSGSSLGLTEDRAHAQQRAGAFKGVGEAVEGGERLVEGPLGRGEVAVDRGKECPATRRRGECPRPSLLVGALDPLCEDVASACDVAGFDQGLDSVGPHNGRRVVAAYCDELIGKITQKVGGPVAIAEHQLDSPEHCHHLDLGEASRTRDCAREGVSGRGSGVVQESEICLDERFTDDEPPVVDRLALLAGDGGFPRRSRASAHRPASHSTSTSTQSSTARVFSSAARRRLARQLLQERTRLLDLTHSHLLSGQRAPGTIEELEREMVSTFDLDAAIE